MLRLLLGLVLVLASGGAVAQDSAPPEAEVPPATLGEALDNGSLPVAEDLMPAPAAPRGELTLWAMIVNGGVILWSIIALSGFTLMLALYLLATVSVRREVPPRLARQATEALEDGNVGRVYKLCERQDSLLAAILKAGVKMAGRERYIVQEAMESEGERGASALWQRILYLSNIGQIAPLMGLLGTVWAMMQAFGSIALDDTQVRSLRMAEAVAQAMITTAAGLALAIPAMLVYFLLRGRVIKIVAAVEAQAAEFLELFDRANR